MGDLQAVKTSALHALTTSNYIYGQYSLMQNNNRGVINDLTKIDEEKIRLSQELSSLKDVADTYDREYLDRVEAGIAGPGFWQRKGFRTLGDWALFGFYITYAALFVFSALFILKKSSRPLFSVLLAFIFFSVFGLVMTAFLMRVL